MTIQQTILSSSDFSSFYNIFSQQKLRFKLAPYGWEKIVTPNGEEPFDLMQTSAHINKLCQSRKLRELDPLEVEHAETICNIFRTFWHQLADELKNLDYLTSTFYRATHAKRYVVTFSDFNEEWLNLWRGDHPDTMLRPSWYIFGALHSLSLLKAEQLQNDV